MMDLANGIPLAFTMLWQDSIGGLEILNKNAEWIPAPPIEDTFVVNVGDWLQRVSNGRFVSTVHRVKKLTGDKPRYSMPFFFGLDYDAYCEVRVVIVRGTSDLSRS